MARNGNKKHSQVIEGEVIPRATPPARFRLSTVRDLRREMGKVYAEARNGSLPTAEAARLTWMLQTLVAVIRDSELEQRIIALENSTKENP